MPSTSSRPVARLSSPGDVVATVPLLCGFTPQDSVVLLSLRGPRRRLGLTIRLDLPPPALAGELAEALVAHVLQDGGRAAVCVVYADEERPDVAQALQDACATAGVAVVEALHVRAGRWTSYACRGSCCPPSGTPLGEAPSLVRAEHALAGRAVLPARDDLVRSLAPPAESPPGLARAWRERAPASADPRPARERCRAVLEQVAAGVPCGRDAAVEVAVALHDVRVRDQVATWGLEDDDALLSLLEQVVRQVGPPFDAPACAVLAWVSYGRGDGARANVALDRALSSDPQHSLALLLRAALDSAVPPEQVRAALRASARASAQARRPRAS